MKNSKRIATGTVTVLAAVATAHLMQSGSEAPARMAAVAPAEAGVTPDRAAAPKPNPVTFAVEIQASVATPDTADLPESAAPETAASAEPAAPTVPIVKPARTRPEISPTPSRTLNAAAIALASNEAGPAVKPGMLVYPETPRLPEEAVMPVPLPRSGAALNERMAATATVPSAPVASDGPALARSAFGLNCGTLLTAASRPAAMVALTLNDPCRGGEVFTMRHGPLSFTAALDPMGGFAADIPVLSTEAPFMVSFADGSAVETLAEFADTTTPDRAALFTDAASGLAIHALEFGADYEEEGHVWPGNRRDAEFAARAGGGFLTVLGDASLPDARIAQIYSFPAGMRHREGVVRLSVETEVTQANCARDVAGQILQAEAGQVSAPVALTLAMPDCTAVGEFLVLKNLLRDLKIASN